MSIEEREDNELGELPPALLKERKEGLDYVNEGTRYDGFFAKSPFDQRNYGAPPDISLENQVINRPGEIGSVPRRYDVTSTFDARPVNGRDFLETFTLNYQFIPPPPPLAKANQIGQSVIDSDTFTVPDGYVGVVRGFRYFVNNMLNLGDQFLLVTLISDGVPVNNYDKVPLPQIVNDFISCYGISNPLKTIGLTIEHPEPAHFTLIEDISIRVELYGNLLLSRGIPSQYEPTNSV